MSTQRALIVTMAGTSTRFRATAGREVLKCLYHEGKMEESLLGFFTGIAQAHAFNAVRFVGGYQFDELQAAVEKAQYTRASAKQAEIEQMGQSMAALGA